MSFALKLYSRYIANFDVARETLEELKFRSKRWPGWLQEREESDAWRARFKGNNLASVMMMPVQRIPRYEMLLRDLFKYKTKLGERKAHEPDWMDELEQCLEAVHEVAVHNNEQIRRTEWKAELCVCVLRRRRRRAPLAPFLSGRLALSPRISRRYKLQNRFGERLDPPLVGPGVPLRALVREGNMRKLHGKGDGRSADCVLLLLSDMLLYTTTDAASGKLKMHHAIPFDGATSFKLADRTDYGARRAPRARFGRRRGL